MSSLLSSISLETSSDGLSVVALLVRPFYVSPWYLQAFGQGPQPAIFK